MVELAGEGGLGQLSPACWLGKVLVLELLLLVSFGAGGALWAAGAGSGLSPRRCFLGVPEVLGAASHSSLPAAGAGTPAAEWLE